MRPNNGKPVSGACCICCFHASNGVLILLLELFVTVPYCIGPSAIAWVVGSTSPSLQPCIVDAICLVIA